MGNRAMEYYCKRCGAYQRHSAPRFRFLVRFIPCKVCEHYGTLREVTLEEHEAYCNVMCFALAEYRAEEYGGEHKKYYRKLLDMRGKMPKCPYCGCHFYTVARLTGKKVCEDCGRRYNDRQRTL